ncbi:MAG: flagellar biosynthesis protein FlhB [Alicyclobacillaceae bacterium]|nr:flagellar biosynthesis protein FlhB [Alicyclobacillaceae bacterium]
MLPFQLQRFAEDKTERATPHRRRELRRQGRVVRSHELTAAVSFLAALVVLRLLGPFAWNSWSEMIQSDLGQAGSSSLDAGSVHALLLSHVVWWVRLVGPVLAVAALAGGLTAFAQVGALFLPQAVMPDLQRLNPLAGARRLWSVRSALEAGKALAKLAVVSGVAYVTLRQAIVGFQGLFATDPAVAPGHVGRVMFQLGAEVGAFLLGLAAVDYVVQRLQFERSIRMSRQEVRDELKQLEGDPQVKSRIRARGRALALRRMMQEVPKADVVVTNPTHVAVALRYDGQRMSAPTVIAKGVDELALRIRRIAEDAGVPVVENRPLAHALHRAVEVGQEIPADLYRAVAEVLAYVYRLQGRAQSVYSEGGSR